MTFDDVRFGLFLTFRGAAFVAGGILWLAYLFTLFDWLGYVFGIVVAVLFCPGALIFPIMYWIVEGTFPALYVAIELAGIACLVLGALMFKR